MSVLTIYRNSITNVLTAPALPFIKNKNKKKVGVQSHMLIQAHTFQADSDKPENIWKNSYDDKNTSIKDITLDSSRNVN